MSIRKGWLVLLALVMLWTSIAMAAAEGLDISITTDKTSYAADETAVLTIDITNQTNGVVQNLNIQNYIPTGLKYVTPAEANKVIAELQPGGLGAASDSCSDDSDKHAGNRGHVEATAVVPADACRCRISGVAVPSESQGVKGRER